jgi:hypothetical protein
LSIFIVDDFAGDCSQLGVVVSMTMDILAAIVPAIITA